MPDSDSQALLRNARCMFDAGKLRTAARLCREYLNIDAKNVEALDLFGAILIKAGLNEKAVNVLDKINIDDVVPYQLKNKFEQLKSL